VMMTVVMTVMVTVVMSVMMKAKVTATRRLHQNHSGQSIYFPGKEQWTEIPSLGTSR